jgi:DNA-binding NarL/FixJ family response regulator
MQWRRRAEAEFGKHCEAFLLSVQRKVRKMLEDGTLTRIHQPRGRAPLDRRYEWAVRRYCLGHRYKDIATDEFNEATIRQAVSRIFSELKLESVTQDASRDVSQKKRARSRTHPEKKV